MPAHLPCFAVLLLAVLLSSCSSGKRRWEYEYKHGKTAAIIHGRAVPPANLPPRVLRAIDAGNRIVGLPYKYGGGHRSFYDSGYDCSGTVSFVLHATGCLKAPTTSNALRGFGKKGEGRHITVYAKRGHCFIEVAGLRLDTGYNGDEDEGPRWTTRSRPTKGYTVRHPAGL